MSKIIQPARCDWTGTAYQRSPAIITVNGVRFNSTSPFDQSDCLKINQAAKKATRK